MAQKRPPTMMRPLSRTRNRKLRSWGGGDNHKAAADEGTSSVCAVTAAVSSWAASWDRSAAMAAATASRDNVSRPPGSQGAVGRHVQTHLHAKRLQAFLTRSHVSSSYDELRLTRTHADDQRVFQERAPRPQSHRMQGFCTRRRQRESASGLQSS